jgi:hypothetical protein
MVERNESNKKALQSASKNAEKAFEAVYAREFESVSKDEKVAWAMAAIIHCDMFRLVVAFNECEREGIARLLWMADIASKLHEAKRWYFEMGNKLLHDIARKKGAGSSTVKKRLKNIKAEFPIEKINKYADYRNKFCYHYDADAIEYLREFGGESADSFFDLLKVFIRFSGEWAKLTRSLLRNELSNKP